MVYSLRMELKKYLAQIPQEAREAFAARCNTTYAHLRNVAYGKTCGEDLAMAIDQESLGAVPCEVMRPDLASRFSHLRGTKRAA